jgi:hypothetical protein
VLEEDRWTVAVVDEVDRVIAVGEEAPVEGELFLEPSRQRWWREQARCQSVEFLIVLCSTSCAALAVTVMEIRAHRPGDRLRIAHLLSGH